MKNLIFWGTFCAVPVLLLTAALGGGGTTSGGASPLLGQYKLLEPISHGDLTIFPVVTSKSHDASEFLTLDEGIRSGEVVVTEVGNLHGVFRRRRPTQQYSPGAQVNTLVLVNNSKRPLILLAGEVVTGGKQDRLVGKDRIVAPESDPIDLSVFCVEHGRWIETSHKFDTHASVMAQPSVRKKAMVDADQQKVWDEVASARAGMAMKIAPARPAPSTPPNGGPVGSNSGSTASATVEAPLIDSTTEQATTTYSYTAMSTFAGTTSYATVREIPAVKLQVEGITAPMQKSYESVIKQLRNQDAVGVVVAVKGRIVWADIFASSALLSKYWPKLLQSYAAESLTASGSSTEVTVKDAQRFLDNWEARHEIVDSEPGLYRQRELVGDRFRAFELTSLLAKANFSLHLSKMAE